MEGTVMHVSMYMYEEHQRTCATYLVALGCSISEESGRKGRLCSELCK